MTVSVPVPLNVAEMDRAGDDSDEGVLVDISNAVRAGGQKRIRDVMAEERETFKEKETLLHQLAQLQGKQQLLHYRRWALQNYMNDTCGETVEPPLLDLDENRKRQRRHASREVKYMVASAHVDRDIPTPVVAKVACVSQRTVRRVSERLRNERTAVDAFMAQHENDIADESERKKRALASISRKKKKSGRRRMIQLHHIDSLVGFIRNEKGNAQLNDLSQHLRATFPNDFPGNSPSESTVMRAMQACKLRKKAARIIQPQWNSPATMTRRTELAAERDRLQALGKSLVYIDECHFCNDMGSKYVWAIAGEEVTLEHEAKACSVSLFLAVDGDGVVHYEVVHGSVDSERFLTFLRNMCGALKRDNRKKMHSILYMDNVSIHRTQLVRQFLARVKNPGAGVPGSSSIGHLFAPPYSPFLSVVEYVFGDLKRYMKMKYPHGYRNRSDLVDAIGEALEATATPARMAKYEDIVRKLWQQVRSGMVFMGNPYKPKSVSVQAAGLEPDVREAASDDEDDADEAYVPFGRQPHT